MHTQQRELRRGTFSLDFMADESFEGYTLGEDWNGWACPRFPKAEGLRIVEAFQRQGFDASYDEEQDTFRFTLPAILQAEDATEEADSYGPADGLTAPDGSTLYAIGAWNWIWSEEED